MINRELPFGHRPLVLLVLAAVVAVGCTPGGGDGSPSRNGTNSGFASAAPVSSAPPVVSDDGDTTGDLGPVATIEPAIPSTPEPRDVPAATPDVAGAAEAAPRPFAMNLYRKGDFVGQYTFEWCVGASLQMAVNVATDKSRTSRADQQRLWGMARDTSFSPYGGANPRGWTATLNDLGIGPYRLVSLPTLDEAVTVAAEAIRDTGRPVGLVMWAGRHAWVMTGFESTGDPGVFAEIDVTGIRVLDPLYPHGSSAWGRSPKPNSLISPATLGKQFVFRDGKSRVKLDVPPGYLLVLPVATEA